MDLARFITREEHIGGLEISDSAIRIALYNKEPREREGRLRLIEEPVPEGVFVEGELKDAPALERVLARALAKAGGGLYFIVSIPPIGVYMKTISFPKSVAGEELDEAIRLSRNFQLPFKPEDAYIDHEVRASGEQSEVLLAAIPKNIVDMYGRVLEAVHVKTVAVESSLMSIARSTVLPDDARIITVPYADFTVVAALDGGIVRFSRMLPRSRYKTDAEIKEEVRKIRQFYGSEFGTAPKETAFSSLQLREEYRVLVGEKPQVETRLLVVMGALARGLLPREADTFISLLPVGTRKAYEYQKAVAFGSFVRGIVISASFFFVLAYAATWLLTISLNVQTSAHLKALDASSDTAGVIADETKAHAFNSLVQTTGQLVKESPAWSSFLETLRSAAGEGITLTNVTIGAPAESLSLVGIAATRDRLNAFRKTLAELPNVESVTLPLTNLEARADIPFTVSFRLADPAVLYPH